MTEKCVDHCPELNLILSSYYLREPLILQSKNPILVYMCVNMRVCFSPIVISVCGFACALSPPLALSSNGK